jgi:polysaccharide deacetylase family protein (PEP-CTERM system associated)
VTVHREAVENAFTVDLEDWYQGLEIEAGEWHRFEDRIQVGTGRLLDLLAAAQVRATFFVLGYVAEHHGDLVRRIHAAGHEIGTHGYAHQFVYRLGREAFKKDLLRSLEQLDRVLGTPVAGHRAPFFSITGASEWAFDVLAECGLRYDSSVFPIRNYRYGMPSAPRWPFDVRTGLTEFPLTTLRLAGRTIPLGGGAYFRIFPYAATRYGLRHINASGHAAVFYIHPWELDPEHPRLDLPRRIKLTHYWNLQAATGRLQRLLADFRFTTMGAVLDRWKGALKRQP